MKFYSFFLFFLLLNPIFAQNLTLNDLFKICKKDNIYQV